MPENVQEAAQAPAERTPLQEIREQETRLAEAMTVFRRRVLDRVPAYSVPPEVQRMLEALHIPALTLNDEATAREIRSATAWDGDVSDYTGQGLRKEAAKMQEKTMQWFTALREQLGTLRQRGLISHGDVADALRAAGAPEPAPEPRMQVRFSIVGEASAPSGGVEGAGISLDGEALQSAARDVLRRAIEQAVRTNQFMLDGDLAIEVTVTRG